MFTFTHSNFHVADLEKSIEFYNKAFGFVELERTVQPTQTLVHLADKNSTQEYDLELTQVHDKSVTYPICNNAYHQALLTDDIDSAYKLHTEMGIVVEKIIPYPAGRLYFITDPDGHWIEVMGK